jgi:hypothetical protein
MALEEGSRRCIGSLVVLSERDIPAYERQQSCG